MAVGCIFYRYGSVNLKDLKGMGKTMPLTMFAFALGGLGMIGVPMTAGFISKWYLVLGALDAGAWWMAVLILLASLLAVMYIFKVIEVAYFHEPPEDHNITEAPVSMLIPTYVLVLASVYFGIETQHARCHQSSSRYVLAIWRLYGSSNPVIVAVSYGIDSDLGTRWHLIMFVMVHTLMAMVTFYFVIQLIEPVMAGETPTFFVAEMFPGLSLSFSVEPLGLMFALVASGLWIPTSVYAFGYMRGHHESNQTRFFTCFALAIGFALGVAFSENLLTLFCFYEALTFSTYPLVTHHQDAEAKRAGRIYMGILVTTSVCLLLAGVAGVWYLTNNITFTPGGVFQGANIDKPMVMLLLALFSFGTAKAALFPFHKCCQMRW